MKIACVVDPSPPPFRAGLVRQVGRLLREWGVDVSIRPATGAVVVDGPDHDLYVIAAEGDAAFAVAADVDAHGGSVLNTCRSLAALRQPRIVARRLAAVDVPFSLSPSVRGAVARPSSPEITLDGVGGHVFGVVRRGPGTRDEPFTLGSELHGLALRCARALDLDLFAIDLAIGDGAPRVVAVRPFPALRGVPDAALRLADFVYASAERGRAAAPAGTHPGVTAPEAMSRATPARDVT
jgi:hypothetical protein